MMKPIKKTIFPLSLLVVLAFGFPANASAETYTYDVTGRLTRVTYDDGSSITYTYDNNGNILNVTANGPCPIHPADLDGDFDIEPGELSGYVTCFLRACTDWAGGGPLPPPPGYVSRSGTLFLSTAALD